MARTERLGEGEVLICHYCDTKISNQNSDSLYVVVGENEQPWHVECADSVGIPVEDDPDEHDPDFDYDPDYDGAQEDDE